MGQGKKAIMSECKDTCNRSDKDCICGGHNASNAKSNKKHNATRNKLLVRKSRQLKEKS